MVHTGTVRTDRVQTDKVQTDRIQTDRVHTERVRTDRTDRTIFQPLSVGAGVVGGGLIIRTRG